MGLISTIASSPGQGCTLVMRLSVLRAGLLQPKMTGQISKMPVHHFFLDAFSSFVVSGKDASVRSVTK